MQVIPRTVRTGAMTLALAAAMVAQQDASGTGSALDPQHRQSQGNNIGTGTDAQTGDVGSNPGFGPQVPNNHTQAQPQNNSTYQKDRNGNMGFNLGWLGLLGLAGLFGLGRGKQRTVTEHPSEVRHNH